MGPRFCISALLQIWKGNRPHETQTGFNLIQDYFVVDEWRFSIHSTFISREGLKFSEFTDSFVSAPIPGELSLLKVKKCVGHFDSEKLLSFPAIIYISIYRGSGHVCPISAALIQMKFHTADEADSTVHIYLNFVVSKETVQQEDRHWVLSSASAQCYTLLAHQSNTAQCWHLVGIQEMPGRKSECVNGWICQ